jgi:hypothetical protein
VGRYSSSRTAFPGLALDLGRAQRSCFTPTSLRSLIVLSEYEVVLEQRQHHAALVRLIRCFCGSKLFQAIQSAAPSEVSLLLAGGLSVFFFTKRRRLGNKDRSKP